MLVQGLLQFALYLQNSEVEKSQRLRTKTVYFFDWRLQLRSSDLRILKSLILNLEALFKILAVSDKKRIDQNQGERMGKRDRFLEEIRRSRIEKNESITEKPFFFKSL